MQIQINTGHNIKGNQKLTEQLKGSIEAALSHISKQITRLEVHLSDEHGNNIGPNDIRCMMEARLEGRKPVAVTIQSSTIEKAVEGAVDKLVRLVESSLDRLFDQKIHRTDPAAPESKLKDQL